MYHTSHTRSRSTVRSLLLASRQGSRGLSIGYPLFLNTASRGLVNENGAVVFAETLTIKAAISIDERWVPGLVASYLRK